MGGKLGEKGLNEGGGGVVVSKAQKVVNLSNRLINGHGGKGEEESRVSRCLGGSLYIPRGGMET